MVTRYQVPLATSGQPTNGSTGSGNVVLATSPTLVTPLLGTPTSGVLTNCSGTAASLTSGATNSILTTAVSIVQKTNVGIADSDTDTMVFDFVPSKIVIHFSCAAQSSDASRYGFSNGNCVITITGTDTFTSVMNWIGPQEQASAPYLKYDYDASSTTKIIGCESGTNGAAARGSFYADGAWVTSTKTMTLTWQETSTTTAGSYATWTATAYR